MIIDAHVHVGNFSVPYPYAPVEPEDVVRMLQEDGVDYGIASSGRNG